jgi:prolyl-tRNA synthetase
MRTSLYMLNTLRDTPADAELMSHQLMLKAGLIRKLGTGLYTWLPLGLRVLKKIETIVRKEMNKINGLEILMPAVQPAELWQESGRWQDYGPELLRLKDRHQREFCFGPTHEEVITNLMLGELQSYKQLPKTVYQIQTKFRDEIRPRFGVMRAREFIMKDAYSFHADKTSLETTYQDMYQAYSAIFSSLGLKFRAVIADTGSIGGNSSHEFHVLADAGEDVIAYCPDSEYAANTEMAHALAPTPETTTSEALARVNTPNKKTIMEVCSHLNTSPTRSLKAVMVKGKESPVVLLLLRGDHQLNEIKAAKLEHVFSPLTFADEKDILKLLGCEAGFIGPVGVKNIPIIADRDAAALKNFICGANEVDMHYLNTNWGRDCHYDLVADIRTVVEGDKSPDNQGELKLTRGIEVGHIFQLGTKYSESMKLTVLDQSGKAMTPLMGCYGIGVSRIVAAAIEQNHDERGIIWPDAMAPFKVVIVPIGYDKSEQVKHAADELYQMLLNQHIDVLLDDRKERAGVMFADMDLIGIPHRIVMSEKTLAENKVEYKKRRDSVARMIDINYIIEKIST